MPYRIMFLVLDCHTFRERLLIDEHPRVEAWHQQLADLIATVMQAHGHTHGALIVQPFVNHS
jgi:hypothetical protein